ncbi:hypothetical protein OIV83_004128 [Microbotryomycetes sp. JL201]|nr:hypothetical protein OIV83_004128 [Microbotryomycetes sp. JL201]
MTPGGGDARAHNRPQDVSLYRLFANLSADLDRNESSSNPARLELAERIADAGPAATILEQVVATQAKRDCKTSLKASVNTQRRYQRQTGRAQRPLRTDLEANSDEEARDAGDEVSEGAALLKRRRTTARAGRLRADRRSNTSNVLEAPRVARPSRAPPAYLPSSDLLWSILTDASRSLTESFNILPQLSYRNPQLPPGALAHIETMLANQAQEEEEQLRARRLKAELQRVEAARIRRHKDETHNRVRGKRNSWKNCDRRFEASALIAIGTLIELMADELAKQDAANRDAHAFDDMNIEGDSVTDARAHSKSRAGHQADQGDESRLSPEASTLTRT